MASKPATPPPPAEETQRPSEQIGAEVMETTVFADDALRAVASFEDAMSLAAQQYGTIDNVSEVMGNGFAILKNKDLLLGLPLMFLDWTFRNGDMGKYVSVMVVSRMPDGKAGKYILNDGSTGICDQLAGYTKDTGKTGGLFIRGGLRRSDYTVETDQGSKNASTYYIDTTAG